MIRLWLRSVQRLSTPPELSSFQTGMVGMCVKSPQAASDSARGMQPTSHSARRLNSMQQIHQSETTAGMRLRPLEEARRSSRMLCCAFEIRSRASGVSMRTFPVVRTVAIPKQ